MQTQLAVMLELQDRINAQVSAGWREREHPWYRAIWTECAELLEHHGWKWWKQQRPDREQLALELVDIWHFGLSDWLQRQASKAELEQALSEGLALPPPAAGAHPLMQMDPSAPVCGWMKS